MPCIGCPDLPEGMTPSNNFHILYTVGSDLDVYRALRRAIPAGDVNIIPQYGHLKVTDDGCLEYANGQQPPVPEGFVAETPFLLRPAWPSCKYRMLKGRLEDSGALSLAGLCLNPLSGKKHTEPLTLAFCAACQSRFPIINRTTSRTDGTTSPPCLPAKSAT